MRKFGFVALAACVGAALPAMAQVQAPGLFGSLGGSYNFPAFKDWRQFDTPFGTSSLAGVGAGWSGRAYGGYRFSGAWDMAVAGQYERTGYGSASVDGVGNHGRERHRAWLVDAELGYNVAANGVGIRPFIGVRYLNSRFDVTNPVPPLPTQRVEVNYSGVGPRLGVDLAYRFRGTPLLVFANLSGAALIGRLEERAIVLWSCADCDRKGALALNADAQLGFGIMLGSRASLNVGYRFDGWWGSNFGVLDKSGGGDGGGSAGVITHGPFARVAYNIGAPARPRVAAAPPPPRPQPAPALAANFIVFFEFDRATLSEPGRDTVRQAAEAAKAGRGQRINVTGHADRSGADLYNMSLSLRRANAVSEELVRNGVPRSAIVIVARGENSPLVPTQDGVREAQNRRVEIVLN